MRAEMVVALFAAVLVSGCHYPDDPPGYVWTGAVGDGRFATPGNWSGGRAPTERDVATFSGSAWGADCFIDQPRALGGLVVRADCGSQLMVAAGLAVAGDVVLERPSALVLTSLLQVGGALRLPVAGTTLYLVPPGGTSTPYDLLDLQGNVLAAPGSGIEVYGSAAVRLSGGAAQTVDAALSFDLGSRLSIEKWGGSVRFVRPVGYPWGDGTLAVTALGNCSVVFSAGVDTAYFRAESGYYTLSILFAAGQWANLTEADFVGNGAHGLVLRSSSFGSPWNLWLQSPSLQAAGLLVHDSHATVASGGPNYATASIDGGGNTGWSF